MEEKPNYYAIIPATVRYDNELKANEKLLYGEISALANKTGICFANNNYFSELYEVKPNAIATWIKHLKQKEYIKVQYEYESGSKEIKKRYITICGIQKDNTYYSKEYEGGIQKDSTGGIQKGEDNNTSNINNTSINNKKEIYKESWDCEEFVKNFTEAIVDYLNERTGRQYKTNNLKTISLVRARLKDGFKQIDFIRVVDTKCDEWLDTDMEKYLRPETLFGTKFDNYLNQREWK